MTDTSSTTHPTQQARRLHLAHLATTHRAPLVARSPRRGGGAAPDRARIRAAAFTRMQRAPKSNGLPLEPHEA